MCLPWLLCNPILCECKLLAQRSLTAFSGQGDGRYRGAQSRAAGRRRQQPQDSRQGTLHRCRQHSCPPHPKVAPRRRGKHLSSELSKAPLQVLKQRCSHRCKRLCPMQRDDWKVLQACDLSRLWYDIISVLPVCLACRGTADRPALPRRQSSDTPPHSVCTFKSRITLVTWSHGGQKA